VGRIFAMVFFILHSAIRNLHSTIEAGGDLMLWMMGGPAMHHDGCMALRHGLHGLQGMAALNLTWFQGEKGKWLIASSR